MEIEAQETITIGEALAKSREETVFEGHPADVPETAAEEEEVKADEAEAAEGEKPDEAEAAAAAEAEAAAAAEAAEAEKGKKFKYASHEEAEQGYAEAERLAHQRSEEAARERERADKLQQQVNEALLKRDEALPEEAQKAGKARMKRVLTEINTIDSTDPDYDDKVADIWATFQEEQRLENAAIVAAEIKKYDDTRAEEVKTREQKTKEADALEALANKRAAAAGLDMKAGSATNKLFWDLSWASPEGTTEEKIDWTIEATKRHQTSAAEPFLKDKAKVAQKENEVLERGAHREEVVEKPVKEPLTLSSAFRQSERRI